MLRDREKDIRKLPNVLNLTSHNPSSRTHHTRLVKQSYYTCGEKMHTDQLVLFLHIHFRRFLMDAKNSCYLRHVRPSVRLSACIRVAPVGRILLNLILENFMKMWRENVNFLKPGKNFRHFTWRPKYSLLSIETLDLHQCALLVYNYIRLLVCPSFCLSVGLSACLSVGACLFVRLCGHISVASTG